MGMFDYVNFGMHCPKCGSWVGKFQTKDGDCNLESVEPDGLINFYSSCKCGAWLEFSRFPKDIHEKRASPLTREEVEALGFVLTVWCND